VMSFSSSQVNLTTTEKNIISIDVLFSTIITKAVNTTKISDITIETLKKSEVCVKIFFLTFKKDVVFRKNALLTIKLFHEFFDETQIVFNPLRNSCNGWSNFDLLQIH
jgi:hypothetical protein